MQPFLGLGEGNAAELEAVLDVDHRITDVVGRLDQPGQRMTRITTVVERHQTDRTHKLGEQLRLGGEMAENELLRIGGEAADGVFHEGRPGREGKAKATGMAPALQTAQYPEPQPEATEK